MRTVKGRFRVFIGVVLIAGLGASVRADAVRHAASPAAQEADKQQILTVIHDMQDAWNRGDFRGYMQGFKNPGVIFVSGGAFRTAGRERSITTSAITARRAERCGSTTSRSKCSHPMPRS